MLSRLLAIAVVAIALAETPRREAPSYSVESIVNAASNRSGPLAPNTIVSMYGTRLCLAARAVSPEDLRGGVLPNVLPGTGCRVLIGGIPASIYYASPTQINFLIPSSLLATTVELRAVMDGLDGPHLRIPLAETSPALFQLDAEFAVATRPDGSVVTPETGARPGEVVVLYATGLGRTSPAAAYGQIATGAARLVRSTDFRLMFQGSDVERGHVFYVGLTPGFAGLYQINITLPLNLPFNPEVRIGFGDAMSPDGLKLPTVPAEGPATSLPPAAFHQ